MSTTLYLSTRALFSEANHMNFMEKVGVPPKRKDSMGPMSTEPLGNTDNGYRM
jgi:hypothetical protein